ncbi:low molecular weight phosphatase family protein [Yinghuangia seranimata]|uniref:arsenate reductase/protein-tyrosine-phosphatase family protein n=1 Tax=Yinghuangia seranimata TaxID=408067 RepID=UPI00248C2AE7|nr:low molecular weight phosphatase family protein [Yinghuangia seranimata]MDI2124562.1 low molecular weight phosphatase family protein [Yinghuangia seranimata]
MSSFSVLFVCTGNLYRSPIAERLLAARPGADLRVASAGTHAWPGRPLDAATVGLLRELGADPDGFTARRLDAAHLDKADLVLGLAREHREAAVRLRPAAMRRCFTLTEFVRLTDGLADDPRDVVARAGATRGRPSGLPPESDDIADPDGLPLAELHACAHLIDRAVARLAAVLTAGHEVLAKG